MPNGITRPQLVTDLHFIDHMFAISIRSLDCLKKKHDDFNRFVILYQP